jgi:hypothetical protein
MGCLFLPLDTEKDQPVAEPEAVKKGVGHACRVCAALTGLEQKRDVIPGRWHAQARALPRVPIPQHREKVTHLGLIPFGIGISHARK